MAHNAGLSGDGTALTQTQRRLQRSTTEPTGSQMMRLQKRTACAQNALCMLHNIAVVPLRRLRPLKCCLLAAPDSDLWSSLGLTSGISHNVVVS